MNLRQRFATTGEIWRPVSLAKLTLEAFVPTMTFPAQLWVQSDDIVLRSIAAHQISLSCTH